MVIAFCPLCWVHLLSSMDKSEAAKATGPHVGPPAASWPPSLPAAAAWPWAPHTLRRPSRRPRPRRPKMLDIISAEAAFSVRIMFPMNLTIFRKQHVPAKETCRLKPFCMSDDRDSDGAAKGRTTLSGDGASRYHISTTGLARARSRTCGGGHPSLAPGTGAPGSAFGLGLGLRARLALGVVLRQAQLPRHLDLGRTCNQGFGSWFIICL